MILPPVSVNPSSMCCFPAREQPSGRALDAQRRGLTHTMQPTPRGASSHEPGSCLLGPWPFPLRPLRQKCILPPEAQSCGLTL